MILTGVTKRRVQMVKEGGSAARSRGRSLRFQAGVCSLGAGPVNARPSLTHQWGHLSPLPVGLETRSVSFHVAPLPGVRGSLSIET